MNKKKYSTPATSIMTIESETLMAASDGVFGDGSGIGIGGIENGGDAAEAASKGHYNVWGDDEGEE